MARPEFGAVIALRRTLTILAEFEKSSAPPPDRTDEALVRVEGVSLEYQRGARATRVLSDVSLEVDAGEIVSLVGPSGVGKTSLLKIIGDLITPSSGTVHVGKHAPKEAKLNREFSFVFQNPVLLPWRTVRENVRLAGEIFSDSSVRDRADECLRLVGLEDTAEQYPHELSGGMQSRVAIARALTFDPSVLLMDEPFSDLDELTRQKLNEELLRIWEQTHPAIVFVTHSIPEAAFISDRIVILGGSPATVQTILDVPFGRPRKRSLYEDGDFFRFVASVRAELDRAADISEEES